MASLLLLSSWSIMVAMLSLLFRPSLSNYTQELINNICFSTENHGFCVGIFNNNTHNPNADIKRLCEVSVQQTMVYGTYASAFVTKAKNDSPDPATQDLYLICKLRYAALLDEFVEASLDFAKKDYRSMLDNERKCSRLVADCETVIGYRVPQLSHMNSQVRVLISMSLITTNMLVGNQP